MSRRLKPTLVDYVVIAINPVLIMGLIGSLVYFLLEILYGGAYPDRLQFCLTMFIFAIVLISRIAMEEGFERAAPFGIAIAVLVGIAVNRFVVYHSTAAATFGWVINWGLMALTWWCAHKLTWDCTTLDETEDPSGRGLLETAGIEKTKEEPAKDPPPVAAAPANLPPATELSQKRWQQFLDRPRRPHTPGVWIVYFSLASLPIFGLGQLFIPAANTANRRYVFLLLCVYVGCGLSLLLTTSFLSLRRYLRQRRLEMPAAMAGNWLMIGAVMVVGLLLFSALLPRPAPEYAISALPQITGSDEHGTSPVSAGSEGARDPQAGSDSGVDHSQDQAADQPSEPPDSSAGADTRHTTKGPGGQAPGKSGSPSNEQGPQSSAGKSGTKPAEKSPSSSDSQSDEKSPSNQPADNQPSQDQSPDTKAQPQNTQPQSAPPQNISPQNTPPTDERKPNPPTQAADQPQPEQGQPQPPPPSAADSSQPQSQPPPPAPPPTPPLPSLGTMFGSLAGLFKLALYAVLLGGVAYGAWRWRAELIEIVRGWLAALRDFWRMFFGGQREIGPSAAEVAFHQQQLLWSFSDFVDPFASGMAAKSSPAEVVKYTFAALEVWGREQGFPRGSDATPHEYVALLGTAVPRVRAGAVELANLYSRAVYSRDSLSPTAVGNLSQLWRLMQATRAQQAAIPQ